MTLFDVFDVCLFAVLCVFDQKMDPKIDQIYIKQQINVSKMIKKDTFLTLF